MSMRNFEMTSRRVADGGRQRSGSRGQGKQYNPPAEIIRMPSGSIVSIPPLEPIDLAQARLNKALLLALPVSLGIWGLLALLVWALFFQSH
jgi:hypothetical protein